MNRCPHCQATIRTTTVLTRTDNDEVVETIVHLDPTPSPVGSIALVGIGMVERHGSVAIELGPDGVRDRPTYRRHACDQEKQP
jgi:hypothetical protein